MKTNSNTEWKKYTDLFNSGASRAELLTAARAMRDTANKRAALNNLGITTRSEKKRIAARWEAINAVTDAEAARHCQFAGLPDFNESDCGGRV